MLVECEAEHKLPDRKHVIQWNRANHQQLCYFKFVYEIMLKACTFPPLLCIDSFGLWRVPLPLNHKPSTSHNLLAKADSEDVIFLVQVAQHQLVDTRTRLLPLYYLGCCIPGHHHIYDTFVGLAFNEIPESTIHDIFRCTQCQRICILTRYSDYLS